VALKGEIPNKVQMNAVSTLLLIQLHARHRRYDNPVNFALSLNVANLTYYPQENNLGYSTDRRLGGSQS
jgi:hypothetical protein